MSEDKNPTDKQSGKAAKEFSHVVIVRTDVQKEDFATNDAYLAEEECILRSQQVADALNEMGVNTQVVVANSQLTNTLLELKPELCINFVDTVRGSGALASSIPGIFELLRIPYVGASTLALALNNNKYLTKVLLEAWNLPTPQYQLFRSPNQQLDYDLRYPLIVKLNEEHGSVGIDQASVVTNDKELKARLQFLISTYNQPALVEEFIENGRELTGVVLEAKQTVKVFLSERSFEAPKNGFKLLTFDTKWASDSGENIDYIAYQESDENIIRSIKDDLKKAFEVLKMDDLARFDIILDKYNNHFLVDSNANPSLGPYSSVAEAVQANGQKFSTVLLNILQRNKRDITSFEN
jgi:D-alanine-D-alanine ligase